jgi:hypothetical protein
VETEDDNEELGHEAGSRHPLPDERHRPEDGGDEGRGRDESEGDPNEEPPEGREARGLMDPTQIVSKAMI